MIRKLGYALTAALAIPTLLSACTSATGGSPASYRPSDTVAVVQPTAQGSTPAAVLPAQSAPAANGAPALFDGNYSGYAYAPDEQPSQGEQLTFKVVNGAVQDWLSYMQGSCTPVLEQLYIQGPSPINSGVLTADTKTTVPSTPGAYTNVSVMGAFDGTQATGTVNYVAVGPCVEPQWDWTAVRASG